MANRRRRRVPVSVETEILTLCARRCCLCFHLVRDFEQKKGQIAHLDHNRNNNDPHNLAWLCFDHHDEYDSTTRQSRNYTVHEVRKARARLYEEVAAFKVKKQRQWTLVLDGQFGDFDRAKVQAIAQRLRTLLDDGHLTIKKVDPGSVKLLIESSEEAFERMASLVRAGKISEVLGFPIRDVYENVEPSRTEPAGARRRTQFYDSFEEFFEDKQEWVFDFCRAKLKNDVVAEEAADRSLFYAWRNFDALRDEYRTKRKAPLDRFVRSVVERQIEIVRSTPSVRKEVLVGGLAALEGVGGATEWGRTIEYGLWEAVSRLSDTEQFAVKLFYWEGMSTEEIAAKLGTSRAAVHQIRWRAIQRLRKDLAERFGG